MSGEKEKFPEIITPETDSSHTIICACSAGKERSVFAEKLLKKNGFNCKLLKGGLKSFQEYLFEESDLHDQDLERSAATKRIDSTDIIKLRKDYNSFYNRILKIDDAVWLIFLSKRIELQKFQKTLDKLKKNYGLNVIFLDSIDEESVEENIRKLLLGWS